MLGADATTFAAVFAALYAAHEVGDHWMQTHAQACGKEAPGWAGRILCAKHVVTLAATKAAALTLMAVVIGIPLHPAAVGTALAVDGVSHYWADRRVTLAALAEWLGRRIIPGKGDFYRLGNGKAAPTGTGAYALDQSWHVGWLFIAALIGCMGVA
ncbi:transcriptional regulator [Spirillospora sp. NPDC048911]|uniref:transcriptional regulator n=1 Tax=Spirillospora sp. NPDC048911 TaxID=3364527 RepID=UPI0037236DEF